MSDLKFFKNIRQELQHIASQATEYEQSIMQLKQINNQLLRKLNHYKKLIDEGYALLEHKKTAYKHLLNNAVNAAPLNAQQYFEIDKNIKQFECDITTLSELLKNEMAQNIIADYEKKLLEIHQKISCNRL